MTTNQSDRIVSGNSTRPRGFIDWKPRADTEALLDDVRSVMSTYQAQLPLMIRQIYYRLVASYGYDKTDKFSNRLGEVLNRARRVRLIPMSAIRDDGRSWDEPWGYSDGDHLRRTIYMRGILYRHAPTPKQAAWLRGLVEKLGGRFDE